ncbi:hypothetical protein CAEBREN_25515 [Caenorhabditis brenneri]|uniref:Uncharacterized protein n=1 Tax=Caenorhabditis brenneri TaxID=135651 RepID=G0N537_CAEBE|nr:hypothetical protein CAEBREN_25515 [Caenorhabditis brenneri]
MFSIVCIFLASFWYKQAYKNNLVRFEKLVAEHSCTGWSSIERRLST